MPSLFRRWNLVARGLCGLVISAALLLSACGPAREAKTAPAQPVAQDPAAAAAPTAAEPAVQTPPEPPAQGASVAPDGSVRVALLLPLSGRHAKLGTALLNAAQLALFDIADNRFELIVRDTAGTPGGAQAAAQEALQEGAGLILGPLFATSTTAMAADARSAGVGVISFSNDRKVAGEGVYILGLTPQTQVDRVVDYAGSQGLRRFAILAPATPYGSAVTEALQGAVQRQAAFLSKVVTFSPGNPDPSPEVRALADFDRRKAALKIERQRLRAAGDRVGLKRLQRRDTFGPPDFEAVLLPLGGKSLLSVAPLLPFYDVDPGEVRFLGTALWNNPRLGTEPSLTGGWFAAPPPNLWQRFRERYQAAFGGAPPRVASLGYDATALAAVLAGRAVNEGRERVFEPEEIADPSGFTGVDGIFRFLPDGRAQRGLAVLEMQRDGFRVLDPAPQSFVGIGS